METIRAYHECYVASAQACLGDMAEYALDVCRLDADWFFTLFARSRWAQLFGRGNPTVVAGMSGVELAQRVLDEAYGLEGAACAGNMGYEAMQFDALRGAWVPCEVAECAELGPSFWTGWALAGLQWELALPFDAILERMPFSRTLEMYPLYHEMDLEQYVDAARTLLDATAGETRLRRIREANGLSQSQLARAAGVNVRSIQMYEQRQNDIDRAQANTLSRLAHALGCRVEDLLEQPLAS